MYDRFEKVPEQYRLYHYADAYADRDVWREFCERHEYEQGGERHVEEVDLVGDRWKEYMAGRDRHHALATPLDVEDWCESLRNQMSDRRAFEHWMRVNRLYDWLMWHSEYPHRYNPAMIAAANGEATSALWEYSMMMLRERRIANAEEVE